MQIASYELGKLLPERQRPLPLDLLRIGDSRSDVVPNGGMLSLRAGQLRFWQEGRFTFNLA